MAGDESAAQDVDELDEEDEEAVSRLDDVEKYGLDIILEEDAGDGVVADLAALLRYGVLIGDDGAGAHAPGVTEAVDGRDDGEKVLELVKVCGRGVNGAVERVDEGRQIGAE